MTIDRLPEPGVRWADNTPPPEGFEINAHPSRAYAGTVNVEIDLPDGLGIRIHVNDGMVFAENLGEELDSEDDPGEWVGPVPGSQDIDVTSRLLEPPDHAVRLAAARRRAGYEIGDPSWADVVLAAYFDPNTGSVAALRDAYGMGEDWP